MNQEVSVQRTCHSKLVSKEPVILLHRGSETREYSYITEKRREKLV